MRFKALAVIEVSSMLIMLLTGVVMALLGCKYWSLVGSNLAGDASTLVMTWMASGWRPQLPRRGSGTRPLLRFGVNLTAGNIIYTVVRGTDALLIGRWYGANSLGLYNRASGLLMRPLEQFLAPINAVFIPALSRLQNQAERYRAMFLRLYEVVGLVGFTFSGFFLALSHPLTVVLLGAKWEKSADIFAGFTLAAIYFPMGAAASWLFVSQGRGREMLVTTSINSFFTGASFVAGLPFGPFGVAMGFSLSGLVRIPILYYMVGKRGPVAARDLWRVFIGNIPLWVVAFGITCLARLAVENSRALVQLLVAGPIGMLAVAAFILAIPAHRDKVFHFVRAIRTRKAE
jgi:PST family polysaccharide transporter